MENEKMCLHFSKIKNEKCDKQEEEEWEEEGKSCLATNCSLFKWLFSFPFSKITDDQHLNMVFSIE